MAVTNPTDEEIRGILVDNKIVAVIGMSKNPEKDAYSIPAFLKEKGYKIMPINPSAEEILGEKSYKKLSEVPGKVDIVDVFRPSQDVPNYVADVIAKKPKVFWLQLGIENAVAEEEVAAAGITVVHNKCMMQEYERLL